jgi:cytochrome oxidase Cu insertion factor (SCO1/SenC/PrrC family)
MNSGLNVNDPTVVAAFHAALLHQGLFALLIFALLSIGWVAVRDHTQSPALDVAPEPAGRQALRIGFGLLWVLDGLLQVQPDMAVGLPSQVIEPTASSSPQWVQHLVNWAGTTWSYHPVQAGAATVWIQIGIGLWLLAAPRGSLSRLAAAVSVGWGLVVWVFGEAFGGIFAPGLTWLTGAPGSVLVYCVAGALLVSPDRWWRTPRLGRAVLAGYGVFLVGMAVLQAWPGRGFWGTSNGQQDTLVNMIQSMAQTSQPQFIASLVSGFGGFVSRDGFAVNLVVVIMLAGTGLAFLSGRRAIIRSALIAYIALCLVVWVLIQDLGFFGGLGTDPNSMIPLALLAGGGYLAFTRVPASAQAPAEEPSADEEPVTAEVLASTGWRGILKPATLQRSIAAASFGTMVSVGAIGVLILGTAPMAEAQAAPAASNILALALDGPAAPDNLPAPGFTLTDQNGRQVTLASLRGKVILLTFLDPVCVTDCPLIAQEFRQAGQLLGADRSRVELVAINVNPLYYESAYTQAFDRQEGLTTVSNWVYLTSSPARLRALYHAYGVPAETLPAGAMLGHNDIAFVIDQSGEIRETLDMDPGPGTAATQSSFSTLLAQAATQTLKAS